MARYHINWVPYTIETQSVELYKAFIDDLVKLSPGALPRWILGAGWPRSNENEKINKVLSELSPEQKVFVLIAQSARNGGIHDVLVYLVDRFKSSTIKIVV